MRVLIIGGYGVFGSRLARLLAADARLQVIVAGRSLAKAQALGVGEAAVVDRDGDLATVFGALTPDLVIDASGPFQAYGDDPYRVARAALAAGAHYLDLADDGPFVNGIKALDEQAKAAGRFVLAGASTFPALSLAAAGDLAGGMSWVHGVYAGVSPSPRAPIGRSVVEGVTGYAGKPLTLRRNGKDRTAWPWVQTLDHAIAPPGAVPIPPVRFSLVRTPDLEAVPKIWPQVRTVWSGAGPRPRWLHRWLNLLAALVKAKAISDLKGMAPLFHWAVNRIGGGDDRGGMFVRVTGYVKVQPVDRSWHLIAEGDAGPQVPALAAVAVTRLCLEGKTPASGARSCGGALALADFEPLLEQLGIVTGRREGGDAHLGRPLYRRIMEGALDRVAPAVRELHERGGGQVWSGRAVVERGRNPLGWLTALVFRLPKPGTDVPVRVAVLVRGAEEVWRREFAGRRFESRLKEGAHDWTGLIHERFGPIAVGMALVAEGSRLRMVVRGWKVLGIPLPTVLAPGGDIHEEERDGRFHFHVEMKGPLTGLIVRYRGWLEPSRGL